MSDRGRNLITIAVLATMATALVLLIATSPSDTDRAEAIGERIKCPVCQGEPIADSPSQMARDMMALVSERVEAGADDKAIVDELLASYSGAVLLDPPARGATLILWLAPVAAIAAGAAVIARWRRHPSQSDPKTPAEPSDKARARRLAPLLLLAGAFAVIVVVAGSFLQDREGTASGVADLTGQDLDEVSNDTMEAVIAANTEHPEVGGMRLALAERYYADGDFSSAFPHYLTVAESPTSTDPQAVTALIRLGWMAWLGNAEAGTAIELLDQALSIDDGSDTARYLKAQVLWCGAGEDDAAAQLLEEVLSETDLEDDVRALVSTDLEAIRSGEDCT